MLTVSYSWVGYSPTVRGTNGGRSIVWPSRSTPSCRAWWPRGQSRTRSQSRSLAASRTGSAPCSTRRAHLLARHLAPAAPVQVAPDPAERQPQAEERGDGVGQLPPVDPELAEDEPVEEAVPERPAEGRPVEDDPALPDLEELDRQRPG